ncbi:MAG: hypothetical protein ACYDD7_07045, partial [Acidimicrobiales bacterium]
AHTIAAAIAGAAAAAALGAIRGRRAAPLAVGVAACCAAVVLLRSEGLAFSAALAVGSLAATAVADKARRGALIAVAAAAVLGAGAARLGEAAAVRSILGAGGHAVAVGTSSSGFLADRLDAARETLVRPVLGSDHLGWLVVAGMASAFVAASAARAGRPRVVTAGVVAALGCYAAWLIAGSPDAIPGLLAAFPILAGLVCLRRTDLREPAAVLLGVVVAVFALGVVLTEYAAGGGLEWGGRYFALGIPVVAPLVVVGLTRARVLAVGLGAVMAVVAVLGVVELRDGRAATRALQAQVRRCGSEAGASGSAALDRRPLVVAPERFFPQLDWMDFGRYLWLAPDRSHMGESLARMHSAGVRTFVLVDARGATDLQSGPYRPTLSCGRGVTLAAAR